MINECTRAIVLKKVQYAGSSAIVTVYTERFGLMSLMVRGLSRKGGKSAAIQALSLTEIECAFKPNQQVQVLKRISLLEHSLAISTHPYKTAVALFLAEVLSKTLKEESPDSELFEYLFGSIQYFTEADFSPDFHLVFLMKLSKFFGFAVMDRVDEARPYFDLEHGSFIANRNRALHSTNRVQSALFSELAQMGFDNMESGWSNEERRQNLHLLMAYFQLHLEGMGQIKSLPILEEIFS